MDETQEIIKEQLKKLPKNVKDAVSSIDLGSKIKKIADKNMLHIDQAGDLETETILVMLGLEPAVDYKENIRKELNISRDRAQAITADIDKEIFMTIRESLKKISQEAVSETVEQKQKEIHHQSLTESNEIKKQIAEQQMVKPVSAPPPNLPTQPDISTKDSSEQAAESEAKPLSEGPHFEKKKPTHIDPYREPIE